jgi:hypothetical protein
MKPIYNETTNGFILQKFYFDFRNYFESNTPISGEGQVLDTTCQPSPGCSPTPIGGYQVCSCFQLNTSTAVPPTVTKLPLLPNLTNQTNTTATPPTGSTNSSKPLDQQVIDIFHNSNSEKLDFYTYNNFSAWCYSTMGLFLVFSSLYAVGLFSSFKLNQIAANFARTVSTRILIHMLVLKESLTRITLGPFNDQRLTPIRSKVDKNLKNNPEHDNELGKNSSSSDSTTSNPSDTLSEEQKLIRFKVNQLKEKQISSDPNCPEIDKIDMKLADKCGYQKLNFLSFYFIYLKMNHSSASIPYLKSTQYSKGIMITLVYLRLVAHLASSMYFTLGKT